MKTYSMLISRVSPHCCADMVSFFRLEEGAPEPVVLNKEETADLVDELKLVSDSVLITDYMFLSGFYCLHDAVWALIDFMREHVTVSSFNFFADKLVLEFCVDSDGHEG